MGEGHSECGACALKDLARMQRLPDLGRWKFQTRAWVCSCIFGTLQPLNLPALGLTYLKYQDLHKHIDLHELNIVEPQSPKPVRPIALSLPQVFERW